MSTDKTDGRRNNHGTIGNKGGRKKGTRIDPRGQRSGHQVRAYDEEWLIIREFIACVRQNPELCRNAIAYLKEHIM